MYPTVKVRSSENDNNLDEILSLISEFDCTDYFSNHLGKSQSEQKKIVKRFQYDLCNRLDSNISSLHWQTEYLPSPSQKDSIDIFGECKNFVVAIELDKNRADQVAKKFVSRVALMPNKKVYFISLCYPGTQRMNLNECIKYFEYCANLSNRMSVIYAGIVI